MRTAPLLAWALAGAAAAACDRRPIDPAAALPAPGSPVPAFDLPRAGRPGRVTAASLRGAPAVVALWSTHCPYQGPWVASFDSLARAYGPRGVRVVVLADDPAGRALDSALAAAAWRPAVHDVAVAGGRLAGLFDRSREAPRQADYRVTFVRPSFLLVAPNGRVVRRAFGPLAGFRPALDSLLAGHPAPAA